MRKIFISSVVSGFEAYREAARKAIELMGDRPVMCEDFGARPYASDIACISEVEFSDVYVLIMGEKFGYATATGESVTQMEFRAAKAAGKPVLAFIQQCSMDERQTAFRKEVEDFTAGFFRGSFNTPEELKDVVVKSVRQLDQVQVAIPEAAFEEKVSEAEPVIVGYSSGRDPALTLAFLPQPIRDVDIIAIESRLDAVFSTLGSKGLLTMREGYKPENHRDWTGLRTKDATVAFFADGMIFFKLSPIQRRDDYFSSSFAPPSRIKYLATTVFSIVEATGCWVMIGLSGMDHVMVKELPDEKVTSISMRMGSDNSARFNKLFIPFVSASYEPWVDHCVKRFQRIFAP